MLTHAWDWKKQLFTNGANPAHPNMLCCAQNVMSLCLPFHVCVWLNLPYHLAGFNANCLCSTSAMREKPHPTCRDLPTAGGDLIITWKPHHCRYKTHYHQFKCCQKSHHVGRNLITTNTNMITVGRNLIQPHSPREYAYDDSLAVLRLFSLPCAVLRIQVRSGYRLLRRIHLNMTVSITMI